VRLAGAALAGHLALILFSTVAMVTILAGPPEPWLAEEPARTVMRLGWKFSGPTYVVLGALAALLHAASRFGGRAALGLLAVAGTISLAAELLGTSTGYPFGGYSYTPLLGYRILGLVPFPIPLSWFYMLYAALAVCARTMRPAESNGAKWRWALVAGLVLTAWDVSMDPAMVKTAHWLWKEPGVFYGMPLSNWFGWILSGTIIARVMLAVVSPTRVADGLRESRLPLALYAVNGVMPIALCVRDGLWWAAILGTIAMAVPLAAALGLRPSALGRVGWRPAPLAAVQSPGAEG
jgi:putative membrane protein